MRHTTAALAALLTAACQRHPAARESAPAHAPASSPSVVPATRPPGPDTTAADAAPSAPTALVRVAPAAGGYEISVQLAGHAMDTWSAGAIDRAVGERVERDLQSTPVTGVIFCPAPSLPLAALHAAAAGVGRGRDVVTCHADGRNCPATCP